MLAKLLLIVQSLFANPEFRVAETNYSGQNWTRVAALDNDWAFTYRIGTRIKLRLFDSDLVPYTGDISVDPSLLQFNHDESDVAFNPISHQIIIGWNVRTNTPSIMDQYYRCYDVLGNPLFSPERIASSKVLESQWRPIYNPMSNGDFLLSFTGNHKDSAFFNKINSNGIQIADRQMAPVIGQNRQTDQDCCELPNGDIFTVWTEVQGKSRVRWRVFDYNFFPLTSNYTELPLQLQFGKAEPRVRCTNDKIWIIYHHETHGSEYDGIDVLATILNWSNGAITTHKPEFYLHHQNLNGLQRKPEFVIHNDTVLVVFEHYPNAYLNSNIPIYAGPCYILFRAFDLDGNPKMPLTRVNTNASDNNGLYRFALRPDIDVLGDKAVICWTTKDDNGIYSGGPGLVWAREVDLNHIP